MVAWIAIENGEIISSVIVCYYLSASGMGMPVYKKLGFEVLTKEMVYKVI